MARFNYIALDARGVQSAGVLEANTSNEVVAHLRQSGYFPTSVSEEGKGPAPKAAAKKDKSIQATAKPIAKRGAKPKGVANRSIKTKTLMIFTRQLATLIDAGLP
ncbi:MAG TPA: type II secretion system F family protein, partial [Chthoniobacteraceae bacterium]|nr:type II secretion system F family protein [Chthoniobacteraceae bacterium]